MPHPSCRWPVLAAGLCVLPAGATACGSGAGRIAVSEVELTGPAGSQSPHLAVAGADVVLSWLEPAGAGHAVRVAVREVGGGWRTLGTVATGDSLVVNWADVPSVVPLADGVWAAHWLRKVAAGPYAYHVMVAISPDGGASWGPGSRLHDDASETEHGFVSLVPWDGGAAALWLDGRRTAGDGPMTLRFTTVPRSGVPAPGVEVDPRVCECCQTALAPTARGIVAAYRDRSGDEIRDVAVRRYDGHGWSEPTAVGGDGWRYEGCPVNGPALAARGDTVAVAWFTAAGGMPRVYAAFSVDGGATFGPRREVDDGRPAGRVDVAWWGDAVLVSWIEETAESGDLRVRELRLDGGRGGSTVVAGMPATRAAGFPRLAAAGNTVVVAWTVPGEGGGVRAASLTRVP